MIKDHLLVDVINSFMYLKDANYLTMFISVQNTYEKFVVITQLRLFGKLSKLISTLCI